MVFEVGKCYQHSGGGKLSVLCEAKTTVYGDCLVAEDEHGELRPVGMDEDSTTNYKEMSRDEWMETFSQFPNILTIKT